MKNENDFIQCKNCGEQFNSNFCPNCGQERNKDSLSTGKFLKDYLDEAIGIDDRIWITLKALILQPGKLTLEFFEGKRNKYTSPIKLYLLIVFVFFSLNFVVDSLFPAAKDIIKKTKSMESKSFEEKLTRIFADFSDSLTVNDISKSSDSTSVEKDTKIYTENQMRLLSSVKDYKNQIHLVIFLTLPIAAFVLKLFYFRYSVLQNLIHLIHIYTLVFFYSIVETILPIPFIEVIIFTMIAISITLSFKRVYKGNFIISLLKSGCFMSMIFIALIIFILAVLIIVLLINAILLI